MLTRPGEPEFAPAQLGRAFRDAIENRLQFARGTGNQPENSGGCRLVGECHGEPAIGLLGLLEQPRIVQGEHRLIGKGSEQPDHLRGEFADFPAQNDQPAQELLLAGF